MLHVLHDELGSCSPIFHRGWCERRMQLQVRVCICIVAAIVTFPLFGQRHGCYGLALLIRAVLNNNAHVGQGLDTGQAERRIGMASGSLDGHFNIG